MRFAVTHPLVTHPYHPELVTGAGITAVATAAEAAGFHGFGFTDHPAPSQRWSTAAATMPSTRSWPWDTPPPTPPRCG